ncbi:hypothetical protein [Stetteria hydrogenophila]
MASSLSSAGRDGTKLMEAARMVIEDLKALEAELGAEAVDGLYSILEGSPDVSCALAKKLRGRRDKQYGRVSLFRR